MTEQQPPTPLTLSGVERVRVDRVDELVAIGAAGVPALVELLEEPSWSVRRAVVAGLGALGDLAVGPLCQSLRSRRVNEAFIAATVDALVASTGEVRP